MTLQDFHGLLCGVCENVSHFYSETGSLPRIIYAETGRIYYYSDNRITGKKYKVNVELFTTTEFEPMFEELETVFSDNMIGFDLDSIQAGDLQDDFADHKRVIRYLFVCEV